MGKSKLEARCGTSGFSYAEWKGSFYPPKLPNKDMLRFYAEKLPSVEINNTFYRLPRKDVLEGWASQTPSGFQFTIKASRRITHFKKLKDAKELLEYLLRGLAGLGDKKGPVLFQLPPTMKVDVPLLEEFLATAEEIHGQLFPSGSALIPCFEFRHPSWFADPVFAALEKGGAALVSGDLDEGEKDPPLVKTATHCYLRLRKTEYLPGEVEAWSERICDLGVDIVYAYFKHEELGPELAQKLQSLLGGSWPPTGTSGTAQ